VIQGLHRLKWLFGNYFVEKQLYIRSQGSVKYISLSGRSQTMLALLTVCLCLWVGYASVNTLFRSSLDQEKSIETNQKILAYEDEINRLRIAYDNLNGKLAMTKDWFGETTNRLETRHKELNDLLERHASVTNSITKMQQRFTETKNRTRRSTGQTTLVAQVGQDTNGSFESRLSVPKVLMSERHLAGLNNKTNTLSETLSGSNVPVPLLSENLHARITNLNTRQKDLIDAIEESTDRKIREYTAIIKGTKVLEPESFIAQIVPESDRAMGGPYIPIKTSRDLESSLDRQIYRISGNLDYLSDLSSAIENIPLSRPIHNYRRTSGFGPRVDPFKKRAAFHSGTDFGTPTGTPVHATLNGTVTYAGNRGPYGLVVEIDHGQGFKTRYAHLNKTLVRRGQVVGFQEQIGQAGNTGRSTGPHLHYEIWHQGRVHNPSHFLANGEQIFNTAETYSSD